MTTILADLLSIDFAIYALAVIVVIVIGWLFL
jgi:hypothetical protein